MADKAGQPSPAHSARMQQHLPLLLLLLSSLPLLRDSTAAGGCWCWLLIAKESFSSKSVASRPAGWLATAAAAASLSVAEPGEGERLWWWRLLSRSGKHTSCFERASRGIDCVVCAEVAEAVCGRRGFFSYFLEDTCPRSPSPWRSCRP